MKTKRTAISKRVRFEVFKRDSFKCQYCGSSAPEVILQVDHIHPVAKGGEGDITNLVTSCDSCNSGKSDKLLSDDAAATKRKAQLDQLQERREQLEMMAEWQRGLVDINELATKECAAIWARIAQPYVLNEAGLVVVRKLIHKFGVGEVMAAIAVSAKYLEVSGETYTKESAELALSKLGGICVVQRRQQEDPELHEVYKIRAMLMSRIPTLEPWAVIKQINELRKWYTVADIRARMGDVRKWWEWQDAVKQMTEGAE